MSDLQNAKKYAVRRKRHSIWRNVVTCFAAVVVFCTTYALILPAITMEYSCGKEEHVHADGCYTLSCGLEQTPGHFHDETCYDEEGKLTCGQEEPQPHTHTEACYAPADPTVPTDPICGLEETMGHTHDLATCYALPKVLVCGQQEAAAHTHDPVACYTQQTSITCGLEEGGEHTHSDACYTTGSVLTCTLPEAEGHTHTDVCCTLGDTPELVCTQEETPGHTHTDECYPADAQPKLICGLEELIVHKHTEECYTLSCVLEEHTHTNECQIKKDETLEEEIPADASLEEVNLLAEGDAPVAAERQPFTGYVSVDSATSSTTYIVKDKKYETKIYLDYGRDLDKALTGSALRAANGRFYIEFNKENIQVEYNKNYVIHSSTMGLGKTGTFHFEPGANGHPIMVIDFDQNIIFQKKEDGSYLVADDAEVKGYLFFTGFAAGTETNSDNSLNVNMTDDLNVYFPNNKIGKDTTGAVNYDMTVNKSLVSQNNSYPDGTQDQMTEGSTELTYKVEVISTNGTPGPVDLKDHLSWKPTEGADKQCELTGFKVVKVSNGETTEVDVPQPAPGTGGNVRQWNLTSSPLPALNAGERYEIEYTYKYTFPAGDSVSVNEVKNTAEAESKRPGGRPDETLRDDGTVTVDKITPPSPDPSLSKTGSLNETTQMIDWTVTYNADGKHFGGAKHPQLVITDPALADAEDVKVQLGVTDLSSGQYSVADGKLTIQTPTVSTEKITIAYSTPKGNLDKWTHGEAVNTVTNTASYVGFLPDTTVSADAKVEKKGGDVQKSAGTIDDSNGYVTVPWTVTITPGSDGIPKDTTFTDVVKGNNMTFLQDSVEISYVDSSGAVLGTVQGCTPRITNNSWEQETLDFTFAQNPFDADNLPKGPDGKPISTEGVKIVVSYKTQKKGSPYEESYTNTTNVDGKTDTLTVTYKNDVNPAKTHGNISVVTDPTTQGQSLSIPWTVTYWTNSVKNVYTPITDTLTTEGRVPHYYDQSSVSLVYKFADPNDANKTIDKVIPPEQYTLTFYENYSGDPAAGEGSNPGAVHSTYLAVKFNQMPHVLPDGVKAIEMKYNTITDTVPAETTTYRNKTYGFNKSQEDSVTYDPPGEVTKTHGDHTLNQNTVTIPWSVTVETEDGKISTPITDSLIKADGTTKNHCFPEDPHVVMNVLDDAGNVVSTIDRELYTVTYYTGYSGSPEAGIGEGEGSATGTTDPADLNTLKTYMVIRFNDTPYTIPEPYKSIKLTYETVASLKLIPEGEDTFLNQAWANKRTDTSTDVLKPSDPVPESKTAGTDIVQDGDGIRIPWTVIIRCGDTPLTMIEEAIDTVDSACVKHYFDISSLTYEFLDENQQSFEPAVAGNPADEVVTYSNIWGSDHNGFFKQDTGTVGQEPAVFMQLKFKENAFKNAPANAKYLKLTYYTYNPDITAEQSITFRNVVRVSGQLQSADASITKVRKEAESSLYSGQWKKDPVDAGENNGQLNRWRITATTGTERSFLTITDVLPQYVELTNISAGADSSWIQQQINRTTNAFTGTAGDYTFNGEYARNEEGRYVLSLKLTRTDGSKIPKGTVFQAELTPVVDKDSLPSSMHSKKITLLNTATVTHDEGSITTNPSTQTWTDPRDDIAKDSLKKGRYYAPSDNMEQDSNTPSNGQWALRYYVDINKDGEDVEPDGNSFILVDTLTYDSSSATNIQGLLPDQKFNSFDIRLDTSDQFKLRIYKAKLNADGTAQVDASGRMIKDTELPGSEWAMTVDTQKEGTSVNKIIRVSLPDATPMIMEYSYNVEPNLTPEGSGGVSFNYQANNKVVMLGHKRVDSSETSVTKAWQSAKGGGSSGSKFNSFIVKKVDAANNAQMLSGAKFKVSKYLDGEWVPEKELETVNGIVEISAEYVGVDGLADSNHWLRYNTLYKIVETDPPRGYVMPDNPEEFFFYISSETVGTKLDPSLTQNATDLTRGNGIAWVENTSANANFKVEKIWKSANGETIGGENSASFILTQYKSTQKPAGSDVYDPLVSTRTMRVKVNDSHSKNLTYSIEVPKGATVRLTINNPDPNTIGYWLNNLNTDLNIPDVKKDTITNASGQIQTLVYEFPVNEVSAVETCRFEADGSKLKVTLAQVVSGSHVPAGAEAQWNLTLSAGNNYKWSSQNPGADINNGAPLPFKTVENKTTYYYTYVVQEQDSGRGYVVSYSNVDSDGNLIPVSSGTIRVVNTMPENPPISLPNTGGIGTTVFTLAGLALTGGAGLGLCKTSGSKAKRKRGKFEKQ